MSTRYEYDILGRKSRIYNDDGLEVRYNYDALNRISHIRYGNGVETAYAYDGDGNLSCLETKAGEDILFSFAYQYDGNGNRIAKAGIQASVVSGGITEGSSALDISYSYDIRGRLLEERRNGASICYAYDRAGNRIKKTDAQGATIYQFNRKNQLITKENPDGRNEFTYDRQGGIVEEKNAAGIRLFSYNNRHQQTMVETESGSIQENRYDVENLRFELLENGKRTSFVYHNGELLHEERREAGQTSYHLGAGIDALQRGQDIFYCHRDEQLSTMFVTGREAVIQNSYQYDAFGAEAEVYEQFPNRIRYTGQQYDELTGQYYLRARYYDSVLGRFMQEDVYQGDGLNLYAYCHNNPVRYYDLSGYGILSFLCPKSEINEGVGEIDAGQGQSTLEGSGNNQVNTALTFEEALEQLEQSGLRPGQTAISRSRVMELVDSYDPIQAQSSVYTDSEGTRYLVEGHHTTVAATMLGRGSDFNMNAYTNQVPSAFGIHWVKKWFEFWKKVIEVIE